MEYVQHATVLTNSETGVGRETGRHVPPTKGDREAYTPGYTSRLGRGEYYTPGYTSGLGRGEAYTPGYTSGLGRREVYTPGYTSGFGRMRGLYTRVYFRVRREGYIHLGIPQGGEREAMLGVPQGGEREATLVYLSVCVTGRHAGYVHPGM